MMNYQRRYNMYGVDITDQNHRREYDYDSDDSEEVMEESPCGRWLKRREEVHQQNIPGIDHAYVAMDTEEGVEVVWNEVNFSERKNFKLQEQQIRLVFENLTRIRHPNIVKFYRFWTDTHNEQPRVIFITEHTASGSLKQFLKCTKKNGMTLPVNMLRKWSRQILSALSYLHSCCPPIVHGYLTCDTIFIQHDGLAKIGSVAPDIIHRHVKTCRRDDRRNDHFIAPEYLSDGAISTVMDVYSMGMCVLEMSALNFHDDYDSSDAEEEDVHSVTDQTIKRAIRTLKDDNLRDFIRLCLDLDPQRRPSARKLLFHAFLFEIHSLKLLAAHTFVTYCPITGNIKKIVINRLKDFPQDEIFAILPYQNKVFTYGDIYLHDQKLDAFVQNVANGVYPLTTYVTRKKSSGKSVSGAWLTVPGSGGGPAAVMEAETRKILNMMCNVTMKNAHLFQMTILLKMEEEAPGEKLNRKLTCTFTDEDTPSALTEELVIYGFINEEDKEKVFLLMEESFRCCIIPAHDHEHVSVDSRPNSAPSSTSKVPPAVVQSGGAA